MDFCNITVCKTLWELNPLKEASNIFSEPARYYDHSYSLKMDGFDLTVLILLGVSFVMFCILKATGICFPQKKAAVRKAKFVVDIVGCGWTITRICVSFYRMMSENSILACSSQSLDCQLDLVLFFTTRCGGQSFVLLGFVILGVITYSAAISVSAYFGLKDVGFCSWNNVGIVATRVAAMPLVLPLSIIVNLSGRPCFRSASVVASAMLFFYFAMIIVVLLSVLAIAFCRGRTTVVRYTVFVFVGVGVICQIISMVLTAKRAFSDVLVFLFSTMTPPMVRLLSAVCEIPICKEVPVSTEEICLMPDTTNIA